MCVTMHDFMIKSIFGDKVMRRTMDKYPGMHVLEYHFYECCYTPNL